MSCTCEKRPVAEAAGDDFREPSSLLEALRILRSNDPYYMSMTHPSNDQIEDLDAVIKGLRLQLDNDTIDEAGDETAFDLAVALLWHEDRYAVQEGIQLMEYLLKERWSLHWSAVTGQQKEGMDSALVEGVVGEEMNIEDQRADTGTQATFVKNAAAVSQKVLVGTAVRGATAPPPPEDEASSSVPPSLTRDRSGFSLLDRLASFATASSTTVAGIRDTKVPTTTNATTSTTATSLFYTSPYVDSSAGTNSTASASTFCTDSVTEMTATVASNEELAQCYYHLAVGYTKLRTNDRALFCTNNMLRLSPNNKDGLRLKRLLSARLYVSRMVYRTVPFLALGLLFL